ncbi:MAG: 1-deoxy-D-xylulose-5-phosphate reductoisomerase [Pseudomonadota bacterium]
MVSEVVSERSEKAEPAPQRPLSVEGRRKITILGATGSIGSSTLDVIRAHGGAETFDIKVVAAHRNAAALAETARELQADVAIVSDEAAYPVLRDALAGSGTEAAAGPAALIDGASEPVDWCMAAIAGVAGLEPSIAAARAASVVALANKETLVSGATPFFDALAEGGGFVVPTDSEHSAIFQVFETAAPEAVERVVLTASGGPFRTWTADAIATATPEQALQHPNWSMGSKITVDSASMFNKALEVIEAARLFPVRPDQIEVIVHPQSIVHSMVGYIDGSVLAQLGAPDMRTPIAFALGWPNRVEAPVERLDFATLSRLDFEAPDEERFPALRLAREALEQGRGAPCVLNAANEVAVAAFLGKRMNFGAIPAVVEEALASPYASEEPADLDAVRSIDSEARRIAADAVSQRG